MARDAAGLINQWRSETTNRKTQPPSGEELAELSGKTFEFASSDIMVLFPIMAAEFLFRVRKANANDVEEEVITIGTRSFVPLCADHDARRDVSRSQRGHKEDEESILALGPIVAAIGVAGIMGSFKRGDEVLGVATASLLSRSDVPLPRLLEWKTRLDVPGVFARVEPDTGLPDRSLHDEIVRGFMRGLELTFPGPERTWKEFMATAGSHPMDVFGVVMDRKTIARAYSALC